MVQLRAKLTKRQSVCGLGSDAGLANVTCEDNYLPDESLPLPAGQMRGRVENEGTLKRKQEG